MNKYRLNVIAHGKPGYYESGTLVGLLLTRLRHKLDHLIETGKWVD